MKSVKTGQTCFDTCHKHEVQTTSKVTEKALEVGGVDSELGEKTGEVIGNTTEVIGKSARRA